MRTAPPRGNLSRSNPLAQGLSSAVLFDEQTGSDLFDRVSNELWRLRASADARDWDGSNSGNGFGFTGPSTGANDFQYLGNVEAILATSNLTVVIVQRKLTLTNNAASAFGNFSGSRCQAHMPYSDGVVYWDFGGTSAPNRLSVSASGLDLRQDNVWTFTAGGHGSEIWFNGHRLANNTTAVTRTADATDFFINSGAATGDMAVYSAFYVYQRVLQEAEIKRIAIDPYAPFRPQEPLAPADTGVTGTGASTLDGVTSAGSGTFTPAAITGTGASTLAGVTSAGAGTYTPAGITGTGTSTLDGVASTGSGTFTLPGITGTGASTLAGVTSSGSGTVANPITGIGASTLAGVTSVGVGFSGDMFLPEITCETLTLGAACETTVLPVVCAILSLDVECEQ